MSNNPSVGRIVHYVARGSADGVFPKVCRAGIITATCAEDASLRVDQIHVRVFNPDGDFFNKYCNYDGDNGGGTWHWPERVP